MNAQTTKELGDFVQQVLSETRDARPELVHIRLAMLLIVPDEDAKDALSWKTLCTSTTGLGSALHHAAETLESRDSALQGLADETAFRTMEQSEAWALIRIVDALRRRIERLDVLDVLDVLEQVMLDRYARHGGVRPSACLDELVVAMVDHWQPGSVLDLTAGTGRLLSLLARRSRADDVERQFHGHSRSRHARIIAGCRMLAHDDEWEISPSHPIKQPFLNGRAMRRFDVVVGSPPWREPLDPGLAKHDIHRRFWTEWSPRNGNIAYVQHAIAAANPGGHALLFALPSLLFGRGRDQAARERLVDEGLVSSVVSLPAGVWHGTALGAVMMVLGHGPRDRGVMVVDASGLGERTRHATVLGSADMERVLAAVQRKQITRGFSRVVEFDELEENGFDLSPSRYLEAPVSERSPVALGPRLAQIREQERQKDEIARQLEELFEQARP